MEIVDRGFVRADPGAQTKLFHGRLTWQQAQDVRDGAVAIARVVGEPTHRLLSCQTPDQVLDAMQRHGLGRPSTYAGHIDKMLTD